MNSHSYFAELNDENVVIGVHVVTTEFLAENPDRFPGRYVRTYFDLPNKTYAGIGYIYLPEEDDFVTPPPSPDPTPIEE
jgi:hypothetical protein